MKKDRKIERKRIRLANIRSRLVVAIVRITENSLSMHCEYSFGTRSTVYTFRRIKMIFLNHAIFSIEMTESQ